MSTDGGPTNLESAVHRLLELAETRMWSEEIQPMVCEELIDEHRRNPFGRHSANLDRVLNYLRRNGGRQSGQYVLLETVPGRRWELATLSDDRSTPPEAVDGQHFDDRAEAEHAVFIQRLRDRGLVAG